jgi:hypothetical protein
MGFGFGSKALRSGITCLLNSSSASMGNCSSGNGWPNVGPKRNTFTRPDASRDDVGQLRGRHASGLDVGEHRGVEAGAGARHLIGEVDRAILAEGLPLHPMRPSGVVSHVLLLRQQPCTITTGTC